MLGQQPSDSGPVDRTPGKVFTRFTLLLNDGDDLSTTNYYFYFTLKASLHFKNETTKDYLFPIDKESYRLLLEKLTQKIGNYIL